MRESDWDLLDRLVPGTRAIGADEHYWLGKSEQMIAISTQSREIYPVLDHSRGHGCWLYDLQGNEYLDVSSGVESAPGRKDHGKIRDFVAAVRAAEKV